MNIEHKVTDKTSETEPPSRRQNGFYGWLKSLFSPNNGDYSLKESLEEVIDELEDGESSFGAEERSIIKNTLTFRSKRVDDIMVPRTDIIAVEASSSFEEVMEVFFKGSTSRLPVYRDTLDEVIAMVHIKDAFRELVAQGDNRKAISLRDIQRPILFVPPSMKLFDLLTKMQATHIHMALVVDEYGGTDGLLTIEDLVEQIVGDIEDEHDEAEAELLKELPGGDLLADARLPIEELEDLLGLDLLPDDQDEDVDTLGGLVFTIAGYIPEVDEVIQDQNGLSYKIVAGDARSIKTVLIRRKSVKKIPEGNRAEDIAENNTQHG
ncbi:transporter associated domain-containing protein [Paremcibacter congregatus]|uniref:Magnesium/cobalt efflux protein n=1 Tax=Paremcibacter congregatus TaxID=2043170 RepID=A0A2G4YUK0_9PROT|nr:hemolysin family protein [Paremcibacter congregatus]PHZ86014.1 magnesium/cobalt efflux protein [Paremcibacter congregatus]QDE26979.1 HlyC/CorC family transporter [Paremcibacter congregatus]|tara:strand:+ start:27527 stop:28492 length:966 start_codon:yes stop_codon:yes gene_type:complete